MYPKVQVSKEVFKGMEAVKNSGLTNMFHKNRVEEIAWQMGEYKTVEWLRQIPLKTYARAIVEGLEVREDEKE